MNFSICEATSPLTAELASQISGLMSQLSSGPAPSQADLEEIVGSEATCLLIAEVDGAGDPDSPDPASPNGAGNPAKTIAGCLTLVLFRIPTGLRARIEDVVVDQQYRGQGIGRALNQTALERAKAAGARSVDLTSNPEREAANQLYVSLGFERRATNVYRYSWQR